MTPVASIEGMPRSWILVFERRTGLRWVSWLCWGTYKHVKAMGYLPSQERWLFFDFCLDRLMVATLPDSEATTDYIGKFVAGSDLLAIEARCERGRRPRVGFWCVPAVKHLIGLKSGALRPDRLWDDCLRAGGEPLYGQHIRRGEPATHDHQYAATAICGPAA